MGNKKQLITTLLVAGGLFLFWPLTYAEYSKIGSLRAAIKEREQIINERTEIQQHILQLKAQYDQQASEINNFAAIIPTRKSNAEILSALEAMINQSGNAVSGVSFSTGNSKDRQYQTITISLRGKGSYFGIKALLDSLERSIPLVDVESIQLALEQQTNQLDFAIQATSYFIQTNDATGTE